jgi:hypothetical protein
MLDRLDFANRVPGMVVALRVGCRHQRAPADWSGHVTSKPKADRSAAQGGVR